MNLEIAIFNKIHSLTGQSVCFDSIAIFLAQEFIWILTGLLVIILLVYYRKTKISKIFFLGSGTFILSYILLLLIQFIYFRPRPFVVLQIDPLISVSSTSASFPSFHTILSFVFALTIYSINKKWGSGLIIFACLIGTARIFVGVHWLTDVLAGMVIAISSFNIIRLFLKNINL